MSWCMVPISGPEILRDIWCRKIEVLRPLWSKHELLRQGQRVPETFSVIEIAHKVSKNQDLLGSKSAPLLKGWVAGCEVELICISELSPDVGGVVIKVLIFPSPHNSVRTEWSRYHANSHKLCFKGEKRVCFSSCWGSLSDPEIRNPFTQKSEIPSHSNLRRDAFMILIQFPLPHSNIPGNGNLLEKLSPSETRFEILGWKGRGWLWRIFAPLSINICSTISQIFKSEKFISQILSPPKCSSALRLRNKTRKLKTIQDKEIPGLLKYCLGGSISLLWSERKVLIF